MAFNDTKKIKGPAWAQKRISEYFTNKYDDIDTNERVILSRMANNRAKRFWSVNDFRSVGRFQNDGDLISGLLTGLNKKG